MYRFRAVAAIRLWYNRNDLVGHAVYHHFIFDVTVTAAICG